MSETRANTDRHEREVKLHKTIAKEYALRYGSGFSQIYQAHWNEELMKLLPASAERVLDCGCGTGVFLEKLAETVPEATGLDISPDMLASVPDAVKERCTLICGPVETAELPANHFDAVVCRGVLHHVADLPGTLKRIRSLLRPGGVFVFSEPCSDSLLLKIPRWAWRNYSSRFDPDHHALGSKTLREQLAEAGFAATTMRKFGFVAFPLCSLSDILPVMHYLPAAGTLTRFLIGFDALCSRIPLINNESWHIIVRAEVATST